MQGFKRCIADIFLGLAVQLSATYKVLILSYESKMLTVSCFTHCKYRLQQLQQWCYPHLTGETEFVMVASDVTTYTATHMSLGIVLCKFITIMIVT